MRYFWKLVIIGIFLAGCATAEPTATPAPPATATSVPTATPLPTSTPVPTATPTPAPLKPNEIFDLVSPSVAFIDTEAGSGSGVLVDGGYVVTNAHVVWPFNEVRVVFSDGSEFPEAPVVGMDLMGDLAVIGPLDTELPALALVDGEELIIGNDVYLIGYPGEVEEFPQPTISRGLISRMREWERIGMTYFQTDAAIAGGQSGGVLVSELGDVVGISGFTFADAEFGLVASAADILPRVEGLIAGEDVDGLGERRPQVVGGKEHQYVSLMNRWDSQLFVLQAEKGEEVEVVVDSDADYAFVVRDVPGNFVALVDDTLSGVEQTKFDIGLDAPYFVEVYHSDAEGSFAVVEASTPLSPYKDSDGGKLISVGDVIQGNIDFPGDLDVFRVVLDKGEVINIRVESVMIDSLLSVEIKEEPPRLNELIGDDNSGGGVFGFDAELSYKAPVHGAYYLILDTSFGDEVGGYYLVVDRAYEGAPTPIVPTPTPRPVISEYGELARYSSDSQPTFAIQYPADWHEVSAGSMWTPLCKRTKACFSWSDQYLLAITEEDLETALISTPSQKQYVAIVLNLIEKSGAGIEVTLHETVENKNGYTIDVLKMTMPEDMGRMWRMIYVQDNKAFNATYIGPNVDIPFDSADSRIPQSARRLYGSFDSFVDYSFDSFQVLDD